MTMAMMKVMTQISVIQGGMPNMLIAAVMPMNSVTIVRTSVIVRSVRENHPQNGPKASKIASAKPRFVIAPSRTHISWHVYATGKSRSSTQTKLYLNSDPVTM